MDTILIFLENHKRQIRVAVKELKKATSIAAKVMFGYFVVKYALYMVYYVAYFFGYGIYATALYKFNIDLIAILEKIFQ